MREESHLDEMRSAIRGDFERLAERRGEQELLRVTESASGPEPEGSSELEFEPEQEVELEQPRRSWVSRLLSP